MDKYRSKHKKRRGLHGYKTEKFTTTTTQSESIHMQDCEEPDLSLSSVRKTEKEFVVENVDINKIAPTPVNSKKYHDKSASTRL